VIDHSAASECGQVDLDRLAANVERDHAGVLARLEGSVIATGK
jgi:hypothetical protein